ncbi:aminotransferase class V-fold PLP-dependent enzyme [Actinomadura rayongensis]|uniref:Aminotransferase class V-fold PLP-dependent enzyme n=1 Tax=Actinomadura rayongensis TaxID=1429076 RepID=A0A6I4WD23_9ACTN|nr:aminotransferase class V-fold PLP-dependent enzyme [Actinomadura rayongensis]
MTIDVARVRAETPGCAGVVHFNNAGAALPPRPVLDAVLGHLRLEAEIGGYEAADRAAAALDDFYPAVAALLGAHPDEIAYVENATRAWDMAFHSVPFAAGDRILTTTSEYASNAIAYRRAEETLGVRVAVVPDGPDGLVSLDALAVELARGDVRLVSLNHVPTYNGLVNPAAEVGRLCRSAGVLYLLDACQSVGQRPVDVAEIGCDLLSATGRKFLRGPRGTGFLYVRRGVLSTLVPPFLDLQAADWRPPDTYVLRDDARRFETWERFFAGQIGLGVAARYAASLGVEAIASRVTGLAADLRGRLAERPGVTVLDRGAAPSGIVTFTVDGVAADDVRDALRAKGVNVSVAVPSGHGYTTGAAPDVVRASVHYYNTEEEIGLLLDALPVT